MVILIFDLDHTLYDLDLNLLYEKIKINAVILIIDLNFSRSMGLILVWFGIHQAPALCASRGTSLKLSY